MIRLLILIVLLFTACNSPKNNRVLQGAAPLSESLSLAFENLALNAEVHWVNGPFGTTTKKSELVVFVKDSNGEMVSIEGELSFYAWMPDMGHPAEDMGYFEEVSKGVYINSQIKFNMPGKWEMSLQSLDNEYDLQDEVLWLEYL